MLKRLYVYFKEMNSVVFNPVASIVLFFQIYFLILLMHDKGKFSIGISEAVGALTVFGFLLFLRIADDFKDYKTDLVLFPNRTLPSGRVLKKDLIVLLVVDLVAIITLNIIFMNNLWYFLFLMGYGTLMSVWFFSRAKIQKSLPLALITHNPVQLIINLYIISFTCIKYNLPLISYFNFVVLFALYFDGLVWEIGRKIRAPKDETEYVTYSKLFGYKKPVYFILGIMFLDFVLSTLMVIELFKYSFIGTILGYVWFFIMCILFTKNPEKYKMKKIVESYLSIQEVYIVIIIIAYLIFRL